MIQPLVVRPLADGRYEVIAGERRLRAAREAGLDVVPAIVRDEDATRRMQTALIENVAREDLNPVDEARACAALVDELGLSKEELGRRIGRSRVAVSNLIRLLDLPDPALELLELGELSEGHGRALLQAKGADAARRARQARGARGLVGARDRAPGTAARPPRERRSSPIPTRPRCSTAPSRRSRRRSGAGSRSAPRTAGSSAELRFDDLDELLEFAKRRRARAATPPWLAVGRLRRAGPVTGTNPNRPASPDGRGPFPRHPPEEAPSPTTEQHPMSAA